ncbi:oligosaccharide flippase family protein [Piscinibacter sakaiensis]|uniref:oligosaccharide flippase family protein n=1 Tax=Piscinibacter sakaiensis TaxID=1547922 RepID=UPI0018D139DA|nr:oligosaccharide flippase family protein [Piscinibacter sakaiensis]
MPGTPVSRPATLLRSLPPVYAAAAVRVAFPLLVLPVVAQRLGLAEFGRLGLCLVWANLLALVVEGGFLAAATRHAVVADAARRLQLARRVFSARCVLCLPVALAALGVGAWVIPGEALASADRWETALLLAVLACVLGWPATWYLQATSQLHRWARVELAVAATALALNLWLAHSVAAFLALQCLSAGALAALGWRRTWHELRAATDVAEADGPAGVRGLWARAEVAAGLRLGGPMLPVAVIGSAYSLALPAVAAHQLGRVELGTYYLADRIVRALVAAGDPLVQLVYPRIVARFPHGPRVALAYALRWCGLGLLAGLALMAAGWLAWPWAAPLLRAAEPARLAPVAATLGLLLPLVLGWRFAAYWMLGSGRYDSAYRACIVVGGLVGLGGAWWLGDSATALAAIAVAAETAVMLAAVGGMLWTEARRRRAAAG